MQSETGRRANKFPLLTWLLFLSFCFFLLLHFLSFQFRSVLRSMHSLGRRGGRNSFFSFFFGQTLILHQHFVLCQIYWTCRWGEISLRCRILWGWVDMRGRSPPLMSGHFRLARPVLISGALWPTHPYPSWILTAPFMYQKYWQGESIQNEIFMDSDWVDGLRCSALVSGADWQDSIRANMFLQLGGDHWRSHAVRIPSILKEPSTAG